MANITIPRQLPKRLRAPLRAYGVAVGELVWASNYCLSYVYLLYRELFTKQDLIIAVKSWHTQRSDRGQYDLIVAAVEGHRRLTTWTKSDILWAIKSAVKLSEIRNDAVHAHTTFLRTTRRIVPDGIDNLPSRIAKLSQVGSLIRMFGTAKGDFIALAAFAYYLWHEVAFPDRNPLPKKPRLRSLPK